MYVFDRLNDVFRKAITREINFSMSKPTTLLLFLTYRCTSRCGSCVMWKRPVTQEELSLVELKKLTDMIADLKFESVELFGGDALLRKDILFDLSKYMKTKGIPNIDLVTNCNLIDDKTAQDIVESGIDVVYISLDGVEETHNKVRGIDGTFAKVENAIKLLLKYRKNKKPKIAINSTISALNVDSFEKIIPFVENIGADSVALEYVGQIPPSALEKSKIGNIKPEPYFISDENNSILVNVEQAKLLKKKIKEIKNCKQNSKIEISTKNIDILSIKDLTTGNCHNNKCYIARYMVAVDPYGNVMPCAFYNNYQIGNIKQNHLKEIWNNKKHEEFLKHTGSSKNTVCKHCIMGVERNPTFWQSLVKSYLTFTKQEMN